MVSKPLIIGILVPLTIVGCAYLFGPSIRARYLFKQLETLQLGHSTFEDAEHLAQKIGAKPYGECDSTECGWNKKIDNAQFPAWWRGLGETFSITFAVKNGKVVHKDVAFGTGIDGTFHPSKVSVEEQDHWVGGKTEKSLQSGWYSTDLYRYYWFTVHMRPNVSIEVRRRYSNFNYGCLWKYQGCRDARELLPTADPFHSTDDEIASPPRGR